MWKKKIRNFRSQDDLKRTGTHWSFIRFPESSSLGKLQKWFYKENNSLGFSRKPNSSSRLERSVTFCIVFSLIIWLKAHICLLKICLSEAETDCKSWKFSLSHFDTFSPEKKIWFCFNLDRKWFFEKSSPSMCFLIQALLFSKRSYPHYQINNQVLLSIYEIKPKIKTAIRNFLFWKFLWINLLN